MKLCVLEIFFQIPHMRGDFYLKYIFYMHEMFFFTENRVNPMILGYTDDGNKIFEHKHRGSFKSI